MRAPRSISDMLLYWQVATITRTQDVARRLRHLHKDERGQTPTEYLMIVGLMAAVIVLVFVTFYWGQVKTAAKDWVKAVKDAILGTGIKE
jgi:Flp pilus assembly pilin Flp